MEELYSFSGAEWKIQSDFQNIRTDEKIVEFSSWGSYTTPCKYERCDFRNIAIRKCLFDSQYFIECDFSEMDASDTSFINCLFLNCTFNNANFGKTAFIGSAIVQTEEFVHTSNFTSAGMSQSRFLPSSSQSTLLVNVRFHSLGFRHSIFKNVMMRNLKVDHASFENALFENCNIDRLKLDNSSCRGIVFKSCKIDKFESTLSKTIGSIGALEMLESCNSFKLHFLSGSIDEITELNQLFSDNSRSMTFADNGNLFEHVNVMQYLYKASQNYRDQITPSKSNEITIKTSKLIDGFRKSEFSEFLYSITLNAYQRIIENGEDIDLDNILYSLKLMYFLDIREYQFLKVLNDIFDQVRSSKDVNYADFLSVSQIEYYLDKVGEQIIKESYFIRLINEDVDWNNDSDRQDFQRFVNALFKFEDHPDHRLISIHQGSIEVNVELFDVSSFIVSSLIIGLKARYNKKDGLTLEFNPKKGVKTFAKLLEKLPSINNYFGTKSKINKEDFERLVRSHPEYLREYLMNNKVKGSVEHQSASKKTLNKKAKKKHKKMT